MSVLLVVLTIYFGVVMLWAAPRLYQLLRARWRAARKPVPRRAATIHRAMFIPRKASSE